MKDDVTQHSHVDGSKSIKMEEAARWKDMSLSTIHTVGSKSIKMEEAVRWKDYVTQHFHIVGSKNIKMEEAARWEDDVTQHNSHSCFKKYFTEKASMQVRRWCYLAQFT